MISTHSATRTETVSRMQLHLKDKISTHSATRTETATLHNPPYYSLLHFHNQIISHPLKSPPTIPAHIQIRSHYTIFPVRIPPQNHVCFGFAPYYFKPIYRLHIMSEYQWFFHINPFTHPNMVHFCSVSISQVVKSKAVRLFINYICQYGL